MDDNNKIFTNNGILIYGQIKEILTSAREKVYASVNFTMLEAYWLIGKQIVEAQGNIDRAEYGEQLLKFLSEKLTQDFGKGFDESNLRNIRKFYLTFPIRDALRHELGWTHYRLIMKIQNDKSRNFYIAECVKSRWSTRQLQRQINTHFYERLLSSQNKEAVATEIQKDAAPFDPKDFIRNPYVLEFLDIKPAHDLTHQDLGQMQMYVNYYTREMMNEGDNPPIGIILCADKSEAVVRYTLAEDNKQIFASKYMPYLPTEAELIAEVEREKRLLEHNAETRLELN